MSYIRRIGRIACVLAGLACAWLGLAAAAPAAIALPGIVAATAAPRATTAAASGIEQFRFMSTSATSNTGPVIARGVFTAGGVEIVTSNTTGIFKFPNGTIKFSFHRPRGRRRSTPARACSPLTCTAPTSCCPVPADTPESAATARTGRTS